MFKHADPRGQLPSAAALGLGTALVRPRQRPANDAPAARNAKVLVVDPDPDLRRMTVARLVAANYAVESADGALAALDACVRSRPALVIADFELEDMDGLAFLKELKSRWPDMTVIMLAAHGTISDAVQATQRGAFGFLVKPVGKEELLGQVQRAIGQSTFALAGGDWRAAIVSRSHLMEERLAIAKRAAASDEPILLTGENGTGKELLARAIHAASARRDKPFVRVACGNTAVAELELQLLGDASGEIEDAESAGGSALQRARGGTLMLEEIGKLPLRLQVVLARILGANRAPAADGAHALHAELRLVCTTSLDLKPLAERGDFYAPLYDLIAILPIEIPPLGRRREDIPLLLAHFLEEASPPGDERKIYSPKAIELLATTDWPGNVRQLCDLVNQNVAMSRGKVITSELVRQSLAADAATVPSYEQARDQFSRDYLAANLQLTAGNVSQSARIAKRNRTDFYKLLARYRLRADDFKGGDTAEREAPDAGDAGYEGRQAGYEGR